ncbi:S41 family peptidase [Niabella drilacis]|uniref:N-terminal domain of Peptidase_S41 n=1 Tax=Niabella drilacis (strain DSM 25811 / CCM 8410 / CCUG 62505 / LMG 26954 / E90) TaxID=1285928 RepID=A0A1G6HY77_NIADE|nr:S41 family peptidase [Niabella drilacis]SDB98765.1 N-terminal domain of Peptidase_S41 [Niabella drilacis]
MNIRIIISVLFFTAILPADGLLCAQSAPTDSLFVKPGDLSNLIFQLKTIIEKNYFDKEKAASLNKILTEKFANGDFKNLSPEHTTEKITQLLRKETNDIHFKVTHFSTKAANNQQQNQAADNGGIAEIRKLKNNIGYLKWTEFRAGPDAFKKTVQALERLKGSRALIIDISNNAGGNGEAGGFMNDHLYQSKDYQQLLVKKCNGETRWHQSEVPYNNTEGPRFYKTPVYIITSKNTFSAAEYFAFIAQETGRAVILGDTTAGAGNPGQGVAFMRGGSDIGFFIFVPTCQIQTKAGKSIEAIGVIPDILLTSGDWLEETINIIGSTSAKGPGTKQSTP